MGSAGGGSETFQLRIVPMIQDTKHSCRLPVAGLRIDPAFATVAGIAAAVAGGASIDGWLKT